MDGIVILTGSGCKEFKAGTDFSEMEKAAAQREWRMALLAEKSIFR